MKVEIAEFAENVERLCEHLINKYTEENGRDASDDLVALEKMREAAAAISAKPPSARTTLSGLAAALGPL